jgi:hypothetical protein
MGLGMEAKTKWQLKPHSSPMDFLQGEQRDMQTTVESKHLQEFVPSRKCRNTYDKESPWTYLVWFQNL